MIKKRDVLDSPRLREIHRKRMRGTRVKFFLGVFLFLFILAVLVFAGQAESLNIDTIEIIGNKTISAGVIEEKIREELAGKYLWLFPKTNSFIYPKSKVVDRVQKDFPLIKDVNATLKNSRTLSVSFSERTPAHIWCGGDLPAVDDSWENRECYFMDDSGYIFDEAPYFSGDVYFRFFGKVASVGENPKGKNFFPEIWPDIISFRKTLMEMDLRPSSLFMKEDGDIEIYLSSGTLPPASPKLLLKQSADFESVAENLQAALSTDPLKTDFEKKYSSLLYLDLRFGNKVFFKFTE